MKPGKDAKPRSRRVSVAVMAVIALATAGLVFYYTFVHRSLSRTLQRAKVQLAAGELEQAEATARTALNKDPASEEGYRLLAEILEKDGNIGDAAGAWIQVSQLNPLDDKPLQRALKLLNQGRYDADVAFLLTLNGEPKADLSEDERFLLAQVWIHLENYLSAELLIETLPQSPQRLNLENQLSFARGEPTPALLPALDKQIVSSDKAVSANGKILKARVLLRDGNASGAEALLQELAEKYPQAAKCPEWQHAKAQVATALQHFTQAVHIYKELIKEQPGDSATLLEYAELLVASPVIHDRFERLTELKTELKGNIRAAVFVHYIEALEATARGDFEAAANSFQQTRFLVTRPAAIVLAMNCAIYTNDFAQMNSLLPSVAELPADHVLRKTVTANLETGIARLLKSGDTTGMIQAVRILLQLEPNHIMANRAILRSTLLSGDWREAVAIAEHLLTLRPSDLEAYEAVMAASMRMGTPAKALAFSEQLLKTTPGTRLGLLYRARALSELDKVPEATAAWKTYILAAETPPPAAERISEGMATLFLLNQQNAVREILTELDQTADSKIKVIALLGHAQLALLANQADAAVKFFRQALALSPEEPQLYLSIVRNITDTDTQRSVLEEGLKAVPGDPELTLELAEILIQTGDRIRQQEALQFLTRAMVNNPERTVGLQLMYSDVLSAMGRNDEALAAAEEALRKAQTDPVVNAVAGIRRHQAGKNAEALPLLQFAIRQTPAPAVNGLRDAYIETLRSLARQAPPGVEILWRELLETVPGDPEAIKALAPSATGET